MSEPLGGYAFPSNVRYDREVGFSNVKGNFNPGMRLRDWFVGTFVISYDDVKKIVVQEGTPNPPTSLVIERMCELKLEFANSIVAAL